jgi:hypothetical protein
LISAQSTADPAVKVAGMGGIGKSLLAQEYALRYAAVYPGGVFWVRAHGHDARAGLLQTCQARDADRDMQLLAFAADLGLDSDLQPGQVRGALVRELDARGEVFCGSSMTCLPTSIATRWRNGLRRGRWGARC